MKNDVGYLIKRIHDKLAVRADAELKQYHLTMSQGRVFLYLSSRGGQIVRAKFADYGMTLSDEEEADIHSQVESGIESIKTTLKSTLTSADDTLTDEELTAQAEALDKDMQRNRLESEQMLLSPLSPEEREQLRKLLITVAEHLA